MRARWNNRVTLQDVADVAGVSVSTVSRVIAGHKAITEATAARVHEVMAALDYEPNVLARALRTNQTHTLGLVVQDIANPFYAEVTKGVERAAAVAGYNLILCDSDYSLEREHASLLDLARRCVDGVLLMPVGQPQRSIELLEGRQVPLVLMDAAVDRYTRVNAVLTAPEAGAYEATHYLIGLGHRRIAFLVGPQEILAHPRIIDAYRRAMDEAALPHEDLLARCDFTLDGAHLAARSLLERQRPSAIFALSDLMALGVYRAAAERGLAIPYDLSVMGYDDAAMSRFLTPALTTVAQEKHEIGARGVELMLDLIKRGRPSRRVVSLQPRLIIRQSCAPPDRAAAREAPVP